MTGLTVISPSCRPADQATAPSPPRWAQDWADGDGATLTSVTVPNARSKNDDEFRQAVIDAYAEIRRGMDCSSHHNIVRIWNHIPGIHDPIDEHGDRYMLFNSGRFAAMLNWFGSPEQIRLHVPAASGVGHFGEELVIHALAVKELGTPIENTRQIPAYQYSRRYGPVPPCFSRAMRVNNPHPSLLIAGTAAIAGEASQFIGDLPRQFSLTLTNLKQLLQGRLDRMQQVRVYIPSGTDFQAAAQLARDAFTDAASFELISAELCRSDLLVEIEGLAKLDPNQHAI